MSLKTKVSRQSTFTDFVARKKCNKFLLKDFPKLRAVDSNLNGKAGTVVLENYVCVSPRKAIANSLNLKQSGSRGMD